VFYNSCIIISQDLEYAKKVVVGEIDSKIVKTFYADELEKSGEFKVDLAKEVIRESYIAEENTKFIILCALNYNTIVQNSLLKLLEEPPRNIVFIIIAKTKASLLPTIRSRLEARVLKSDVSAYELGIDLGKLSLDDIFIFLKKHKHTSKDELKQIVETLLKQAVLIEGIKLKVTELDMFDKSLELLTLNSRAQHILSYLLLTIYKANQRK